MHKDILPAELSRWSNLQFVRKRGVDEYSAECPQCGDYGHIGNSWPDRFRMFTAKDGRNGRGWCRSCGLFEWADSDNDHRPTPVQIQEANEERARLANLERERIQAKISKLQESNYWQGWHDAMNERERRMWREQGIPDSMQDWFRLGYTPDKEFYYQDELRHSSALTIPIFGAGWKAVNVQYRLINPPDPADKYRFTAGLPAPLYLTDPDCEPSGPTLLVEGAKKAIVTFMHLGHRYAVVAVPSKTPPQSLIDQLKDCDPVYIMLDPDAYIAQKAKDGRILRPAVKRIAALLGQRARAVRLPAKPDDLVNTYGYSAVSFERFIRQATKL